MPELSRDRYIALYGPTGGDRIRLGDTDIFIEVTEDWSRWPDLAGTGDEAVFGGGKVIRESMGQSTVTRADGAGRIVAIGKARQIRHHGGCSASRSRPRHAASAPSRPPRISASPHSSRRPSSSTGKCSRWTPAPSCGSTSPLRPWE